MARTHPSGSTRWSTSSCSPTRCCDGDPVARSSSGCRSSWSPAVLGIATRLHQPRRGRRRLRVPDVPRSARRPGPLLDDRRGPGRSIRCGCASANSSRGSCTTPWRTTSRPWSIRAQAGRVVATSDPEAAVDALRVIEEEGSRTLAEMRTMVGALRDREDADAHPAERRCRHRAARAQHRRRAPGARRPHRRPGRARSGGRGSHLPHRPGVSDERAAARAQRHPDRRAGRRGAGRHPADGPRRRRPGPRVERQRRLRRRRDDGTRRTARRDSRSGAGTRPRLGGRRACFRGRGRPDDHPRARRRRPGARPDRAAHDPGRSARHPGGR